MKYSESLQSYLEENLQELRIKHILWSRALDAFLGLVFRPDRWVRIREHIIENSLPVLIVKNPMLGSIIITEGDKTSKIKHTETEKELLKKLTQYIDA